MNEDRVELARMAFKQLNRTERRAFLAMYTGPATPAATEAAATTWRILRRAEVAQRLSRSPRAVDLLGAQGILRRVRLPGRSRGAGYLESDVSALIGGGQ